MAYEAIAEDGPLSGKRGLMVERTAEGRWPQTVTWTSGPGEPHQYRFRTVGLEGDRDIPVYVYVGPPEVADAPSE